MATLDDIFYSGNKQPANTGSFNNLQNTIGNGPTFSPAGTPNKSLDSIFYHGTNQQPQPQQQQSYNGPVENNSPLSFGQRSALATAGDSTAKANILQKMGFQTVQDPKGNLLIQSGGKVYPVDEKGFSLGDIADILGGGITTVGSLAGAAAGTLIAPGPGTVAGGAAGAGVANLIQQKLAQHFGSGQNIDVGELGLQTAFGGVAAAIPGEKIVQSLLPGLTERLVSNEVKTLAIDTANAIIKNGGPTAEAEAKNIAGKILQRGLSESLGGRTLSNAVAGGGLAFGSGTTEGLYHGQSLPQALLTGAQQVPLGAATGVGLGELIHGTVTGVGKLASLPEESIASRVKTEFQGKNNVPINEVESFVNKLNVDPYEKASTLDYINTLKAEHAKVIDTQEIPSVAPKPESGMRSLDQLRSETQGAVGTQSSPLLDKPMVSTSDISDELARRGIPNNQHPALVSKVISGLETVGTNSDGLPLYNSTQAAKLVDNILNTSEQPGIVKWLNAGEKSSGAATQATPSDTITPYTIKVAAQQRINELNAKEGNTIDQTTGLPVGTTTENGNQIVPAKQVLTPAEVAEKQFLQDNIDSPGAIADAYGYQIGDKIPTVETLPIVNENTPIHTPQPANQLVNVNEFANKILEHHTPVVPGQGVIGKIVDWFLTPVDRIASGNDSTTRLGRTMARTFGRLSNGIRSLGEVGQNVADTLAEFTKTKDRLSAVAHDKLSIASKTIGELTPRETEELVTLLASNRKANPALQNRELYSVKELQDMAHTDNVKTAIQQVFDVTKEISQLRRGTPYRNSSGEVVYRAGKPEPYLPTFFVDESRYFAPVDDKLLNEYIQRGIDAGKPPEIARSDALNAIQQQSGHGSDLKVQQAAEKFYGSYKELVDNGVVVDLNDALQRMITRDSRQAALVKVMGDKGVPAAGEGEDLTPFDVAKRYTNTLREDVSKALDEFVQTNKMPAKEAAMQKQVLSKYLDVVLTGAKVNDYIQTIKKWHGYKLSFSFMKNFLQPLNNWLATDFPSFAKGISSAYGLGEPKVITDYGFASAKEAAVKSGAYTTDLIEPTGAPLHNKVLDTVLKPMTATEGRNRITSTISGMNYADTLAKALNESTDIAAKIDASKRLAELIGRDVKFDEPVKLTQEDMLNAAYNNTKATQFGYDPLNLPGWVSGTQYGQLAGQFKSYAYNQLGLMFDSTVGELRSGNVGRASRNMLLVMAIFAPAQAAIDALMNYATGKSSKQDAFAMQSYLSDVSSIISGGWADNVLKAPDGKSFVLSVGVGPTGTTAAQAYDATLGQSGLVSDALGGDFSGALEDVYKFFQQQGGGATKIIGNITNKTLGF